MSLDLTSDPQNPPPAENTSPMSPQEPTEPAPLNIAYSESAEVPSEALEAPGNGFEVKSTDIPLSDSTPFDGSSEQKQAEIAGSLSSAEQANPLSETPQTPAVPDGATPQTSTFEVLVENEKVKTGPLTNKAKQPEIEISQLPQQTEAEPPSVPVLSQPSKNMSELLTKEHLAIQNKRRKKVDSIMNLFLKKSKITNDDVEKYLHVSNATATRYLSILKLEGKIKQNGKTGQSVSYSKL